LEKAHPDVRRRNAVVFSRRANQLQPFRPDAVGDEQVLRLDTVFSLAASPASRFTDAQCDRPKPPSGEWRVIKQTCEAHCNDSEQCVELFNGEVGLADDRTQSATVEFFVVWHDELSEGFIATKDDVAAVLPLWNEAHFFERTHAIST